MPLPSKQDKMHVRLTLLGSNARLATRHLCRYARQLCLLAVLGEGASSRSKLHVDWPPRLQLSQNNSQVSVLEQQPPGLPSFKSCDMLLDNPGLQPSCIIRTGNMLFCSDRLDVWRRFVSPCLALCKWYPVVRCMVQCAGGAVCARHPSPARSQRNQPGK